MLTLRSVSAAGRRCKPTPLLALAATPRTLPSSTALPRYQFSSIRSRGMAQVPVSRPAKCGPENRAIVPLKDIDPKLLNNIQGDIFPTFPKKVEQFIFFSITDAVAFRQKLGEFREHITTAARVIKNLEDIEECRKKNKGLPKPWPKDRLVKLIQYQIGFSHTGMDELNIGSPGDQALMQGQKSQARQLGDEPAPESTNTKFVGKHWTKDWTEKRIDGVILAASECDETCQEAVDQAVAIFGNSIKVEIIESGKVRPNEHEGHEHFGYLDGVSQPALRGLVDPNPGQLRCEPGVVILGLDGDVTPPTPFNNGGAVNKRPPWAIGGSIMAFRKLKQRVPEFNKFLVANALKRPGLSDKEAAELRGAKMVGRWKSGVPIDLSPEKEDTTFLDPTLINNFRYDSPEPGQARCPFSAHVRKTSPRKHIDPDDARVPLAPLLPHALMMRAGIPYGREVTPEEEQTQITSEDRGLLFVSYQNLLHVIGTGFGFIQQGWANNAGFPGPEKDAPAQAVPPGLDPIIGNAVGDVRIRQTSGEDPSLMDQNLVIPEDFVVAEGGEYFFIPPMVAIDGIIQGEKLDPLPASGAPGVGAPAGPASS
ncbi:hypothetical protein FS837_012314 [Tulasnella sp. UAMH 9824]|nr:hypothetical protein FS837_012314 [Tulasnella sp. UAMH 9824]